MLKPYSENLLNFYSFHWKDINIMNKKRSAAKKRLWKRHRVRGQAIVLLRKMRLIELGKPLFVEMGPLVDISMGGLAVQYIQNKDRTFDSEELAISVPDQSIKVGPIPFKTKLEIDVAALPDGKIIKKRCIEFGKRTTLQNHQIESFIRQFAMESGVDRRMIEDRRQYEDPRFEDEDYQMLNERRDGGDRRT